MFKVYLPSIVGASLIDKNANTSQNQDTTIGKVGFSDGPDKDAFARLKISNPITLFEFSMAIDDNELSFDTVLTGDGTYTYTSQESTSALTIPATANPSSVIRQSHFYAHYQPGKGLNALFSFVLNNDMKSASITKRVGLFDDNNGIFLQYKSTILSWVLRSSVSGAPVDILVTQNNWNIDRMDGSGNTGIALDPTNSLLGFIDLQWLAVGRVRVGFYISGRIILVHEFKNSENSKPYMKTPYLPIRYEISNTGTIPSPTTLTQVCCAIISDGGYNPIGVMRTISNDTTGIALNSTTFTHCISLRLASGYERGSIVPISFDVLMLSNQNTLVQLIYNPILSGTSYNAVSYSGEPVSATEYSVTGTYTQNSGTVIYQVYVESRASISIPEIVNNTINIQSDIAGTPDVLAIVAKSFTGTPSIACTLVYQEIYS